MLEPDEALVALSKKHKANTAIRRAIPSDCPDCAEQFPSKMALEKHTREKHPKEPAFNDAKRDEFLKLLIDGTGFFKAARALGIHPSTVKRAMQVDPAFGEAVALAEEEAAEAVEDKLRSAALDGDPWAVKEWLNKRAKSRWGDEKTINVNVTGEFTHRAELLPHQNKILELQQRVQERAALNGIDLSTAVIDAEVVEDA